MATCRKPFAVTEHLYVPCELPRGHAGDCGYDYGEGKSRQQEAQDSAEMLGVVLAVLIVAAVVAVALVFWLH